MDAVYADALKEADTVLNAAYLIRLYDGAVAEEQRLFDWIEQHKADQKWWPYVMDCKNQMVRLQDAIVRLQITLEAHPDVERIEC